MSSIQYCHTRSKSCFIDFGGLWQNHGTLIEARLKFKEEVLRNQTTEMSIAEKQKLNYLMQYKVHLKWYFPFQVGLSLVPFWYCGVNLGGITWCCWKEMHDNLRREIKWGLTLLKHDSELLAWIFRPLAEASTKPLSQRVAVVCITCATQGLSSLLLSYWENVLFLQLWPCPLSPSPVQL